MKAITIYQPYASLIACGAKRYETRPWKTEYRGRIAIRAGKKPFEEVLTEYAVHPEVIQLMQDALVHAHGVEFDFDYGAIVAVADLTEVYRIGETDGAMYMTKANFPELAQIARGCDISVEGDELLFGDFTPGQFAWELANVRKLNTPIPCRGKQGLWDVPPDIETKINTQIGDTQCVK